jgi:cell division protein ZapA (FtsZ GTPase activity inhibitor)
MNSTYSNEIRKSPSQVIPIEILGVSFTIRTDEDPEYIGGLVAELKERLSGVSGQMKIVDPLKLALITNLLTLDEMHRDRSQKDEVSKEFEAASLLDNLDRRLGELGL